LPPAVTREAVEHFCRNEWAVHLYDVMIRRTAWRYYHRDHAAIARQVAGWMSEMLGWSSDRATGELAQYDELVASAACGLAASPRLNQTQQVQPA
jgi:glycerol-3-phosphate dehydrogenase